MGKKTTIKSVVVYSMGRDGSSAIADALEITDGVQVRQVYTLNRDVIAKFFLQKTENIPNHIYHSETIVKDDIPAEKPLYFVTMIHDPFSRHIRQAFYLLQHQIGAEMVRYAISNAKAARKYFESIPFEHTTQWFSNEYMLATGVDVYAEPFGQQQGYKIYSVGVHKLLLLSAHLPPEEQAAILSKFIGVKVQPILKEISALDNVRNYFTAQVLSYRGTSIATQFWLTPYARHFFSPRQISEFQQQAEETSRQIETLGSHILKETQGMSRRDVLFKEALSSPVPYLISAVQTLISNCGPNMAKNSVESILRQLERAQKNLLLASIRAFSTTDVLVATELGKTWYTPSPDDRITKSLAAYMQRSGAIIEPLQLLESLDKLDEPQASTRQRLASQSALLAKPFDFSARAKCTYLPKKRRVLYNVSLSLPYHTSGYATRTQGIVKGLHQCGWDVQVLTRKGYPIDTGIALQGDNKANIGGVPYLYDHSEGEGQYETPLRDYIESAAQYLVQQAQQVRPALIHTASNYMCGLAGVEAARRLGIPSIYEMRGLWHITRWSKESAYGDTDHFALAQKMELETALAADHVLAITGALKEWLVDHGVPEDKISIAPNAVDLDQFIVLDRDDEYARMLGCAGKIVIGYIGSFVQYEGLDLLIQAIAMLPEEVRKKIILLWVGDGPVMEELLQLAAKLGISDNILALGRKSFGEIPKLYGLVDICVFPRKGQVICEIISPLKPFEAMAMKKALIVSDVRPLREIINHEITGLIHAKDDAVNLSQQLYRLIEDEELRTRCSEAARTWVEQTRSWQTIAESIAELYMEMGA